MFCIDKQMINVIYLLGMSVVGTSDFFMWVTKEEC